MNSLNIITSRVSPTQPRANGAPSSAEADLGSEQPSQDQSDGQAPEDDARDQAGCPANGSWDEKRDVEEDDAAAATETSTLLEKSRQDEDGNSRASWWHAFPRNMAASIVGPIRWILATLASPGVYLIACLYDDEGSFAPFWQLKKLFGVRRGHRGDCAGAAKTRSTASGRGHGRHAHRPAPSSSSSSSSCSSVSGASSESEADEAKRAKGKDESPVSADELGTARRSIRIKLQHDSGVGQRKHRRGLSAVARTKASEEDLSAQLKSPTSPIGALTRYPETPAPPRPLMPRRQPSYLNLEMPTKQQKTLILDLDETLIHSMSKGGRMSTGHMVEVRLNTASLGMGGGAAQHPILYWVNKRPYCDDFLRRVCKWFNLVVFTASVQEYADPVIDWLESERKFFSARYYRQHCTYRQGAYIKDLSSVEPDLSKVMILDNSPLSYLFHQDNAIPIQGWINDPTDNDLMHLVPLLEGLQYVHDVRALLALRGGEDGQHMA